MAIRINYNEISARSRRSAETGRDRFGRAAEHVATGSRINTAVDDAAGLAVAQRLKNQARSLAVAGRNAQQAISLIQVTDGAYAETQRLYGRMRELAIQAASDTINATDRKVLVFVPFKHALDGISKALTAEGIEHAVVSGDTPANERANVFHLFQNTNKYRVIAAHPQCLAHGITLTAADTIIWFAPVTSLEIYDQANHRIRRVGQKHKQLVLHLQATPVERKIYTMLKRKQRVQDKLLELFEEASKED